MTSGRAAKFLGGKSIRSNRSSSAGQSSSSAPMASANWRRPSVTAAVAATTPASGDLVETRAVMMVNESAVTSNGSNSSLGENAAGESPAGGELSEERLNSRATSEEFVIGRGRGADNVFPSPVYQPPHRRGGNANSAEATPTKKAKYTLRAIWRNGGVGATGEGSGGRSGSPTSIMVKGNADGAAKISHLQIINNTGQITRQLTTGNPTTAHTPITVHNAQQHLPPSACIFVANLTCNLDEATIEAGVLEVFREFGSVFIKIRRDNNQMPFAFCQYTKAEHAQRAMKEGQGTIIHGRACRVEPARANRTYYLTRFDGAAVTLEEANALFSAYEVTGETWLASDQEMLQYRIKDGVFIEFMMYDAGPNLQTKLQRAGIYRLIQIKIVKIVPKEKSPKDSAKNVGDKRAQAKLDEYGHDRNSIFVGNLPLGFTDDDLPWLFGAFGNIRRTEVIQSKSTMDHRNDYVYGFVEFDSVESVDDAIASMHGAVVGDYLLKVNNKDSNLKGSRRASRSPSYSRPAHRSGPGMLYANRRTLQDAQGVSTHGANVSHWTHPIPGFVYPPAAFPSSAYPPTSIYPPSAFPNSAYPPSAYLPPSAYPPPAAYPFAPPAYPPPSADNYGSSYMAPYQGYNPQFAGNAYHVPPPPVQYSVQPEFSYGIATPNPNYQGFPFNYSMHQQSEYYQPYVAPAAPAAQITPPETETVDPPQSAEDVPGEQPAAEE